MKLPKLDVRMFQVSLPSTGQKLTLRPFLVSEERILLEAARTEDQAEIAIAMKQIVNNCTQEELDLDKLPTFDIEFLFLQLRANSVGEEQEVGFTTDPHDCEGDGKSVTVSVDVKKAKVTNLDTSKENTRFMLTDTIGMEMRYPTLGDTEGVTDVEDVDTMFGMVKKCIKQIYTDGGDIFEPSQLDAGEVMSDTTDFSDIFQSSKH